MLTHARVLLTDVRQQRALIRKRLLTQQTIVAVFVDVTVIL